MTILVTFPVIGSRVHFILLSLRRLPAYAVLSGGYGKTTLPVNALFYTSILLYTTPVGFATTKYGITYR